MSALYMHTPCVSVFLDVDTNKDVSRKRDTLWFSSVVREITCLKIRSRKGKVLLVGTETTGEDGPTVQRCTYESEGTQVCESKLGFTEGREGPGVRGVSSVS